MEETLASGLTHATVGKRHIASDEVSKSQPASGNDAESSMVRRKMGGGDGEPALESESERRQNTRRSLRRSGEAGGSSFTVGLPFPLPLAYQSS